MTAESKSLEAERQFLDEVCKTYTIDTSLQTKTMRELIFRTFTPFIRSGRGLELGCSDGYMTEMLASRLETLDVVDGSQTFLAKASQRKLENVKFTYSLFEEFNTEQRYDYVFASYILEHVRDPVAVMQMAHSVLTPNGLIMIVVPNARALSRQLALHMGLMEDLKDLTENDRNHGHRRVYDRVFLNRDIEAAGFENISQGSIMLKILADFQLDELFEKGMLREQHIDGLYRMGLEYPDLGGSLFSICRKR